jgi:transcriptional regulator with XRE-family HTH domain
VAECRNAIDLSQEDLAGKAKLDRKFMSLIETGRQGPGIDALLKISVVTQVSVREMFARAEQLVADEKIVESFATTAVGKASQGTTTCPHCEAVYERYVRKAEAKRPGKFKCRFCKELLASWQPPGPFIIHEARQLPPKSRRAK